MLCGTKDKALPRKGAMGKVEKNEECKEITLQGKRIIGNKNSASIHTKAKQMSKNVCCISSGTKQKNNVAIRANKTHTLKCTHSYTRVS